tara:strand:- start:2219 stop:2449 length:231 start_codon:yes stop_codon:yes gene_type:complete
LLSTDEIVISEIVEVDALVGDPNCKLTKPYKIVGGDLHRWMQDYTDQSDMMISSEKIITLVDPSPLIMEKYSKVTS